MRRARSMLLACVLLGCSSSATQPNVSAPAPAPQVELDDEWSGASWESRHDTMTWLVLPTMARKFQGFTHSRYPELSCFTCHGEDAEQVAYVMPHGLPPLDPEHLPTPDDSGSRQSRYAAFMIEVVTPLMANLLNKPDVTCNTCHPRAGGG